MTKGKDMKRTAVAMALLALAAGSSASTVYNNFEGYSDYWHPLGYPDTATYGETFSAPTNGDTQLDSISFYMGSPSAAGDIHLRAYVATWTGAHAGTLLYSSPTLDYANTGNTKLSFDTGGLVLSGGANYVMFLSISEIFNSGDGQAIISQGNNSIPNSGFAYFNNEADFSALFSSPWSATGRTPNWAVEAAFSAPNPAPEPGSIALSAIALLGAFGAARRRRER